MLWNLRKCLERLLRKVFDERFLKRFAPLIAKTEDTPWYMHVRFGCFMRIFCRLFGKISFRRMLRFCFLNPTSEILTRMPYVCGMYGMQKYCYRNSILDRMNVPRVFGEVTHQRQTMDFGIVAYVDGKILVDTKVFDWFGNGTRLSQTAQFAK